MVPKTRKDSFKVLGLLENASTEEIKKVYRKLALEWHPDRQSGKNQEEKDEATEKTKEITVAYGILTNDISEKFISQQSNDDWVNDYTARFREQSYGSHLSEGELNLFDALNTKDLAQTKILLEKVQKINSQARPFGTDTSEDSILHYIVKNSCNDLKSDWVEFLEEVLLKYGANNSIPARDSSIGLYSQPNIIDVNIISESHGTPLYVACKLGSLDVIKLLLEHGADPNVGCNEFNTPLIYAVREGKNDIVKLFVEHRCKIACHKLDIIGSSESIVEMLLPRLSDIANPSKVSPSAEKQNQ